MEKSYCQKISMVVDFIKITIGSLEGCEMAQESITIQIEGLRISLTMRNHFC